MNTVKPWQFWLTLIVGMILIPLAGVLLHRELDNASRADELETQLAIQNTATQTVNLNVQFADLRGLLTEVYVRLGQYNLPDTYWVAVEEARSARLSLIDGDLVQASQQIANAYEKVYLIPLPVGPPLIHDVPIDMETSS